MAEDFKDPKKLFDPKNIAEANRAVRNLADNANNLKKVSEEFGDAFGRSFVNKVNQLGRDLDNLAAKSSDLQKLEISKSEAMRMQKKLSMDIKKLTNEEAEFRERVEGTLKSSYDASKGIYNKAKANLEKLVASGKASKNQLATAEARLESAKKMLKTDATAYELGLDALDNLKKSVEGGEQLNTELEDYVANWDKAKLASGLVGRTLQGLKKIPLVGDLIDADTMLNVMNKNLIQGEGLFKSFGRGVSAAFSGIEKSTIILAIIGAVVKAIKFVISLAVQAQGQVVDVARNLGITRDSANEVVSEFAEIARNSSNILLNIKALTEAQASFTKAVGATTVINKDLLESQVFLTKNLKLSSEQAADLGLLFNTMGENSSDVLESVINTNNATAKTNGYLIPTSQLMSKIASAGAEVSAYFGNNVKSLAAGVRQVTKFGLELKQALSISKSLLDFESSIANELNAEILLGKEFNFERARSLALQGKIGDATEEVMSQMSSLTDEQRRNPIYLEAAAKAAGLNAEELARSYQLQKTLNLSTKEFTELQKRAAATGDSQLLTRLGLQGASREEIEKTITAQEAFGAALEKAKEQFAELVGSGALEALTDVIIDFTSTMKNWGFGKDRSDRRASEAASSLRSQEGVDIQAINKAEEAAKGQVGFWEKLMWKVVGTQGGPFVQMATDFYTNMRNAEAAVAQKDLQENPGKFKKIKADDFTIQTHPKDTLMMAGGTQLGNNEQAEKQTRLLENISLAIERGGNVYINGNAAGKALVLGTSRLP